MSIPGSANPLLLASAAVAGGYEIERSLRFNSADSAYLSRTPSVSGDRKTWTWAGWVKRSAPFSTTNQSLFACNSSNDNSGTFFIYFDTANDLRVTNWTVGHRITNQVFRDFSSWYHIVVSLDTTNATPDDRIKLYVNGTQITSFQSSTNPSLNEEFAINTTGIHYTGRLATSYFSGYLADIHFIDGQALTPSSFTEVSATTGQLVPIPYTGTYGTNGFRLKFADNSNNTATTLGADTSGNGNNWTPNNLSVTAGSGNDSLVDTPTSYGVDDGLGGSVRGNYATLNPLSAIATLTNGNLDVNSTISTAQASIGVLNGKWYCEVTLGSIVVNSFIGFSNSSSSIASGSYVLYGINGFGIAVSGYSYSSTLSGTGTLGDLIGIALDYDSGSLTLYKNNISLGSVTGFTISSPVFIGCRTNESVATAWNWNFGQRPFAYAAPSGFKALCDTNLPAPVVAKPNEVMDVALWTGNGSARSITGLAFNPDFVWIKGRSGATDHALYDAVRGVQLDLVSNSTAAETTQTQGLTAFNSDGFSLGTLAKLNTNAATYAGWAWDAGTSTVTNTQGSISSQVRANASSGFSVVTYTGTGANATVGHGLGVAPGLVIVKRRNSTSNWQVRHTSIAAANSIQLNLTSAAASATTVWNSTAPSSTVFSVGTDATVNASGATYVAYCFAPVAGYSNGFSYTGNGSTDGSFVYLGFRPRLILLKCSSTTGNWTLLDTAREGYNVDNDPLYPNLSNAEGTTDLLDITSNGFKLRTTDASVNSSGATYVGYAWAEAPFAYSRAR